MLQNPTKPNLNQSQISLELAFERWLKLNGKNGQGHSDRSIQSYISDLRQFEQWYCQFNGEEFQAQSLTAYDLRAWFEHTIKVERLSAATWNRRRASMAQFSLFCRNKGLLVLDPFTGIPLMAKEQEAPRSLQKTDFHRVMRTVDQAANTAKTDEQRRNAIRNRAIVALMAYGGMRVGEVCALHINDLLLSDRKGHAIIHDGKGHKDGTVFLGKEARMAVQQWLDIKGNGDLLFEGISTRQVQRIVSQFGSQVGIDLSCHDLRHSAIYNILNSTQNLPLARQFARHSRIDQTARYAMPHQEDLEAAVETSGFAG
jgi:site-specific recombinase XerD